MVYTFAQATLETSAAGSVVRFVTPPDYTVQQSLNRLGGRKDLAARAWTLPRFASDRVLALLRTHYGTELSTDSRLPVMIPRPTNTIVVGMRPDRPEDPDWDLDPRSELRAEQARLARLERELTDAQRRVEVLSASIDVCRDRIATLASQS